MSDVSLICDEGTLTMKWATTVAADTTRAAKGSKPSARPKSLAIVCSLAGVERRSVLTLPPSKQKLLYSALNPLSPRASSSLRTPWIIRSSTLVIFQALSVHRKVQTRRSARRRAAMSPIRGYSRRPQGRGSLSAECMTLEAHVICALEGSRRVQEEKLTS